MYRRYFVLLEQLNSLLPERDEGLDIVQDICLLYYVQTLLRPEFLQVVCHDFCVFRKLVLFFLNFCSIHMFCDCWDLLKSMLIRLLLFKQWFQSVMTM